MIHARQKNHALENCQFARHHATLQARHKSLRDRCEHALKKNQCRLLVLLKNIQKNLIIVRMNLEQGLRAEV